MSFRINGHEFSWSALTSVVIGAMWLGALSFQVNANGDEIQEQAETKERLVRIEEQQKNVKEDVGEIKAEQKEQGDKLDENALALAKILEKVSE